MTKFIIFSIFISIAGCSGATVDKEDCENRDWAGLGVKDGANGEKLVEKHIRTCRDLKVIVKKGEIRDYLLAWTDSFNINFCSTKSAYERGLGFVELGNLKECVITNGFSKAYDNGKKRGTYLKRIIFLRNKVKELEDQIISSKIKNKRNEEKKKLLSKQRLEYSNELRLLESEFASLPQLY